MLSNNLWRENAEHANQMARMLGGELERISQIKITQKIQANAIFAKIPNEYVPLLQEQYFFYVWDEETSEVRFMTSFDTTEEDINSFLDLIKTTVR